MIVSFNIYILNSLVKKKIQDSNTLFSNLLVTNNKSEILDPDKLIRILYNRDKPRKNQGMKTKC